jgi:hypothetical protein
MSQVSSQTSSDARVFDLDEYRRRHAPKRVSVVVTPVWLPVWLWVPVWVA